MKKALPLLALCAIFSFKLFSQTLIGNQQVITLSTGGDPSTSQALFVASGYLQ